MCTRNVLLVKGDQLHVIFHVLFSLLGISPRGTLVYHSAIIISINRILFHSSQEATL